MMNKLKNVFLTGASGYLGQYLTDELIKNDKTVIALTHKNPLREEFSEVRQLKDSLSNFDWSKLEANLPDVIFHSARMAGKNRQQRKKAALQNRKANERLLQWLETLPRPPLLVFVSGTLVYGSHGESVVDESLKPNPISFQREYFEAEKPILEKMHQGKLPIAVVRPPWIYGPGSWLKAYYLNPAAKTGNVPIYGKGDNLMNFVHVRDVAAMTIHLAEKYPENGVYNITSDDVFTQKEFSGKVAELTNLGLRHKPLWWMRLSFDKAVAEAFAFSLNVTTKHKAIFSDYRFYYPDFEEGMKEILTSEKLR